MADEVPRLPGDVWDHILHASKQNLESTPISRRQGHCAVRLSKAPAARHLLSLSRKAALIPEALRLALRSLVSGEAPWPLFCWGPAGVGKTCGALVLLDHSGGDYWTVPGLCGALIEAQQGRLWWQDYSSGVGESRKVGPEQVWRRIAGAAVVVLDDIGCRGERVSDHHYETVKRVLDDRVGKPLVVLSNLDLETLANPQLFYDDRVASRLAAGTVLRVDGADRRLER